MSVPRPARVRSASYASPLRARQAAETRQMVLGAATRLFRERGWAGTTLAAVATEAGTAVETIYSSFASKMALLLAAIDTAISGEDDERPIQGRPEFALLGNGPRRERLEAAALIIVSALRRAVPLMKPLHEAAANDAEASERLLAYESARRDTVAVGLELIVESAPSDRVVDAMWVLASPEVFVKFTEERGWSVEEYQAWLVETADVMLREADG